MMSLALTPAARAPSHCTRTVCGTFSHNSPVTSAPVMSVAPTPTEEANPEADTADVVQDQTTEAPSDQPVPEEVTQQTAPKETGEVLETEENKDQEVATSAPAKSPLPRKKPEKPESF